MDQWDLLQVKVDLLQVQMDQWDLLQVKVDLLQVIWPVDQVQMDQWDLLQVNQADQWPDQTGQWDLLQVNQVDQWPDQTGQWDLLQVNQADQWDLLQVNQVDQIHYLVKADHKADQDQTGQWDLLRVIWEIIWDLLRIWIWTVMECLHHLQAIWQGWTLTWLTLVNIMDQVQKDQDQMDHQLQTCLQVTCLLHQMTIQTQVVTVCK
jgi:hypothetical protein